MKTVSLLTQNSKIKKSADKRTFNFGIPAFKAKDGFKTCPNAAACAIGCYATQGAYMFGNVKPVFEAQFHHGHDSYNGTISTTQLTGDKTAAFPRYGTKAFEVAVSKYLDGAPKWECIAVEVKGEALKEYRERHGLQRKCIKVYAFFGIAGY